MGPNPTEENNPNYIISSILTGFDTEIDLWYNHNKFYLGHDLPQYEVDLNWLLNFKDKLWIHCKNIDCMNNINSIDFNYFWHDQDLTTLTSKGNPWSQPGIYLKNGITVCLEYTDLPSEVYGICTDYPNKFK